MLEARWLARCSLGLLLSASCLSVPNPAYDGGASGAAGGSGSSTSGNTGSIATEGADGADAEGSGPAVGCGNGNVEDGEACDDGNDDNDDGCLADCTVPRSCLEILEFDPEAQDGDYLIKPYPTRPPWPAWCDMENEDHGGGWTELTLDDICEGRLDDIITQVAPAAIFERDADCRPFTQDDAGRTGVAHAYLWDIDFPPGFSEFYLDDYAVKNNSAPGDSFDLIYQPTDWSTFYAFPNGSLSLGAPTDPLPVAIWAAEGGIPNILGEGEVVSFPLLLEPFELLEGPSQTLRIAWGEIGEEYEGLYPWWKGEIFVR